MHKKGKTILKNRRKQSKAGYFHYAKFPCCNNCIFKLRHPVVIVVAGKQFIKPDVYRCGLHEEMAISLKGICPSFTPAPGDEDDIYYFEQQKELFIKTKRHAQTGTTTKEGAPGE